MSEQFPKDWHTTTVGAVFEFSYGKGLVKKDRNEGGPFPVYGSSGVVGYHDEYIVAGPKVIVGRKGAAGAVHFCPENCWPIDTTYFINIGENIDTKFAFYLLKKLRLNQFETSTAIPGLNRDDAYRLKISLPPLNEQQRIVAKIEALFSELDKGIESLKTAREQLKTYRQAVLKHAFEGKLTDQPHEGAEHQALEDLKLGDMLSFLTSGSRGWAEYYSSKGDIFIRAQNLNQDNLDLTNVAYVALPEKSEGKRTKVQVGDVLITITGANVTKTGFVKHDLGGAYVSQHVALCRPRPELNTEFLYWFLIAEVAGRRQLNEFAYGAGKPGLNLENIRSVKIRVPTVAKQQLIVEKIKEQLSIEENLTSSITAEIQRIETLRQSILKKALSGQLVPQDLNDEPASALLARIQAKRDSQVAKAEKAI
ncbi:MAG: restriction endonuclease subunit S [Pseudomonadaceae bacterium]